MALARGVEGARDVDPALALDQPYLGDVLTSVKMTEQEPGATQQTQPKGTDPGTREPYEPVEIPVPERSTWDRLLRRAETSPPTKD